MFTAESMAIFLRELQVEAEPTLKLDIRVPKRFSPLHTTSETRILSRMTIDLMFPEKSSNAKSARDLQILRGTSKRSKI
jgi:hypothetical protein